MQKEYVFPKKWEKINEEHMETTFRLKVPGGWIVKSKIYCSDGVSIHQIFISDPTYSWEF